MKSLNFWTFRVPHGNVQRSVRPPKDTFLRTKTLPSTIGVSFPYITRTISSDCFFPCVNTSRIALHSKTGLICEQHRTSLIFSPVYVFACPIQPLVPVKRKKGNVQFQYINLPSYKPSSCSLLRTVVGDTVLPIVEIKEDLRWDGVAIPIRRALSYKNLSFAEIVILFLTPIGLRAAEPVLKNGSTTGSPRNDRHLAV